MERDGVKNNRMAKFSNIVKGQLAGTLTGHEAIQNQLNQHIEAQPSPAPTPPTDGSKQTLFRSRSKHQIDHGKAIVK
jgi:hypothetical protein